MVTPISDSNLGDVLRHLLVGQPALKRLLQFLHLVGGKVERRQVDVGDAEHDPFAGAVAGGLSGAILGGAKYRGDRAGRQTGRGGVALQANSGLDLQTGGRSDVGELAVLTRAFAPSRPPWCAAGW